MSNPLSADVKSFFDSYQAAFARSDASAIVADFAYPSHITSDSDRVVLVPVTSKQQWKAQVEQLLRVYSNIGVAAPGLEAFSVSELSARLVQVAAHWVLHDAAGNELYRFDATYTLADVEDALRITALAHNELPRLLACLARHSTR